MLAPGPADEMNTGGKCGAVAGAHAAGALGGNGPGGGDSPAAGDEAGEQRLPALGRFVREHHAADAVVTCDAPSLGEGLSLARSKYCLSFGRPL